MSINVLPFEVKKPEAKVKRGFALVRADQLQFREPEFVIDGLFETETLALLFADPGAGKSFVALDMAASIATGHSFHGRNVKQGAVIYIAGEGNNGIKRRLAAWERHHNVSLEGAPLLVSTMAGQFLQPESVAQMVCCIDDAADQCGKIALIIVDTLNRNMGPGDESSTKDMSSFVAAIDEVKKPVRHVCAARSSYRAFQ
ncbi:MAG: AAA family ATPase [Pseudomonadota bacterium]